MQRGGSRRRTCLMSLLLADEHDTVEVLHSEDIPEFTRDFGIPEDV